MTLSADVVEYVRQRAKFACEYCGITEIDAGGHLTIDHFRPRSHDGTDDLENLVDCCSRCNLHKADYWPTQPNNPLLWNPRDESSENHLLLLADGSLLPITATGTFTLNRLQLNRFALVAHRRRAQHHAEEARLLIGYRELAGLLEETNQEQAGLLEKQHSLLEIYREFFALFRKMNE